MMRVLFLSQTVPNPPNTGVQQRVFHILHALSQVARISLVCPTADGNVNEELRALQPVCRQIFAYSEGSFGWRRDSQLPGLRGSLTRVLRYFNFARPILFHWNDSAQARELLRSLLASRQFDLIWVERLHSLQLLPATRPRTIVDLDDLEHLKLLRSLRTPPFAPLKALEYLEYLKMRRAEMSLARHGCEFVVCSEHDRRLLQSSSRLWVVPNGVDVPSGRVQANFPADPVFVYVGFMRYQPNIDAVRVFVREVLPRIRRTLPNARFVVVGRDPGPEVLRLHDGTSVIVTGTVPDISSYLCNATAEVVPLRLGGGTRIKILEAMANGVPVVSTTMGAEGLEVEAGKHLLVADSWDEFAAACVRLFRHRQLCLNIAGQAFALVRSNYDWRSIQQRVQEIVTGKAMRGGSIVPGPIEEDKPTCEPLSRPVMTAGEARQ